MTNYSRQLDKFIASELYAQSYFKPTDGRTCVSYYIDKEGLIHSSTFNSSIIASTPVTVAEFALAIARDPQTKVTIL